MKVDLARQVYEPKFHRMKRQSVLTRLTASNTMAGESTVKALQDIRGVGNAEVVRRGIQKLYAH